MKILNRTVFFMVFMFIFGHNNASPINDTVWVAIDSAQGAFFQHDIKEKETLYAISKKYGVAIDTIINYNVVDLSLIKTGQQIKIPFSNDRVRSSCDILNAREKSGSPAVCYRIQPGDNLFHLSRRIFSINESCLLKRNQLENETMSIGQVLDIGNIQFLSSPSENQNVEKRELAMGNTLEDEYWLMGKDKEARQLNGAATVQKGTENQPAFVLFDGVPIGSTVRLYHNGTEKSTYCRVVGTIPAKMRAQNLIIVTELIKEQLGSNENRFNVTIEFFKN